MKTLRESTDSTFLCNYITRENYRIIPDIRKAGKKEKNEIFMSIKFQDGRREYGYVTINKEIEQEYDHLFQERQDNRHIDLIEWDDQFLLCFRDGIYISTQYYFVSKEEVFKLCR